MNGSILQGVKILVFSVCRLVFFAVFLSRISLQEIERVEVPNHKFLAWTLLLLNLHGLSSNFRVLFIEKD